MAKNFIKFTSEDEKAFYTVQDKSSGDPRCLGYCFKMMNYKNNDADQVFWVSTPGIFGEGSSDLFARCCKEDKVEHKLKGSKVYSKDGVSFIKSNCKSNFLKFGVREKKKETSAYVFDGKKPLELKFLKTSDSTNDYKLDSSKSSKASPKFDLSKAVGAPVIIPVDKPARNQVVGLLDVKRDKSLYPVFFNLDTFDLDKIPTESPSNEAEAGTENEGHANKENGNKTDIPFAVSETATKETNGDKTDSSVVVSAEAGTENEGHANKENGHKTDIPIAVSETATKETNGDKTDSPVVVSGINQNKESNERKQVYEKTSTTSSSSNNQSIFEAQCIKNKRLGEARQTALLFNKLKILLDPEKPLGGDYRGLADKFGYTYDEICFFGSQPSPTVALLQEQMHKCTFQTLRKYLNDMGREDAVNKIDEYIKQQGCNCHKCCSIR